MKGCIAFDIDGTLTHRLDWIDPKVIAALENLAAADWTIALLTGRIFSFAWKILMGKTKFLTNNKRESYVRLLNEPRVFNKFTGYC